MKKIALICILALAFNTTAMAAIDIAISTQANWWPQATADTEMQEIVDNVTGASVELFSATDQVALANWVAAHTGDGKSDLLILCGQFPDTIYAAGNGQPDGSLAELFLDDGNTIINTGDWIFYVANSTGANGAAGLQNVMDIPGVTVAGEDNTAVTVTAEGQALTPSLYDIASDRPFHLDTLEGPWYAELILAQNAAGTRADPVIVRNAETGGRIGIFFQIADTDTDLRGDVMSEWINNWYLPTTDIEAQRSSRPSPSDGTTDTLRDIVLSWTPGESVTAHNVYFGTDYDSVNAATVSNPLGVLLSQGQTGTTLDLPERLEFGTTYYWRVDEVGATVVQGAVWSFTTELLAYPIENITATSNTTSNEGQGPDRIVDGSGLNEDDQHSMNTSDMWGGIPNATEPSYLLFEFDGVYKLHELLVWNYNMEFEVFLGYGLKNVTLEYSEDGENWSVLGDFELAKATSQSTYTANTTVPLDGVVAQYVRMTINSSFSGSTNLYGLSEVRFTYMPILPSRPNPADGATGVSVDSLVSWRTGREAASHEVYFGTDAAALDMVGTTTQSSYTPTLNLGTEYSWQIVEVNDVETPASWTGPVWTFSTQEYLVIDDFESYIDDPTAGDVIWEIWIDGWVEEGGDPDNGGSVVGNTNSPFAEQTIVHGGNQSMPLYYDNPTASAISEADRTLSPAQDWTAYGVKSLSLWFCGTTGNTGRLYVKINNTKVTYDGSATDIGIPGWQKWNIALADTGASLNNVSSLSVGVEGAGSGLVYIDDIHLHANVFAQRTSDLSIAISAQANWWSQGAADREVEEIVDNAQAPVVVFGAGDEDGLAQWVSDHTNNGVANLLILCGKFPDSIYAGANAEPDGSLAELFLDAGNTIINTGDWIFYVGSVTNNAGEGLQNMMDIPGVTVAGGDDTPVTVTAEGQTLTPSLQNFATDRPFHLDTLDGDWSVELILAQNADGTLADPVIVRNSVTGGRIGVFHQSSGEDNLPRGEVMSEWINNWYLDAAN